ncbi:tetraacyldisaccharide 4'-kinase [uncultured Mucilaginibacter sp.]|uniref:tetraacyldisaccharide 4'-kinase n=1 Tax=uncultured Mucilaginibacter sp. TaxID=797541 RepID=UPI0025D3695C|nr:tetraacyldisaccharide 4'-kinase [uncultured Mucilaginibacter sp.]
MKKLRLLLFPFTVLYGFGVVIRNWLYDAGAYASIKFNLPVIVVGNLDVGGAGKSPMTEYLVRLLRSTGKLATLSRGYGRDTKGFLIAENNSSASSIGDEPAQFKQKFPDITVAVCEKRVEGIKQLENNHDVVILDDAFQHRALTPGLSILLFDFNRISDNKLMLPAGNLREPFIGRYRADIWVVSKCPVNLSTEQQQEVLRVLKPLNYQQTYFTAIDYLPLQTINKLAAGPMPDAQTTVFLLTGIANAQPLLQYIKQFTSNVIHHSYPDHHQYSSKNIGKLAADFSNCNAPKKVIITTEKDAQRLHDPSLMAILKELPIRILPIGIKFLLGGGEQFNKQINNYVREYTTHN